MKMKNSIINLTLAVVVAMGTTFTSCSSDEESFVLRSDNHLSFSYALSDENFTVCTNGDWSITSDCDWLSFSTMQGKGDGTTREKVQVTAARNISEAREGTFILHAAGKDLTIACSQEEGAPLTFAQAKLSASLSAGKSVDGISVDVPYSYGYKGQKIVLHASLSGAGAEGLSIADQTFTLESTEGTLHLYLMGAPTSSGPLVIKISSDDATANTAMLQTSVLSKVILEQHFDLMLWGGDVIGNKTGIMGTFIAGDSGKIIDSTKSPTTCKATTDGSNDLILTMAESYRQLRGFSGWDGSKIYEHPGYIKMGTASAIGKVITPALSELTDGVTSVKVTCRAAQYIAESGGKLTITVLDGGTPSINAYTYKYAGTKAGGTWEDVSFTIDGVTKKTKIQFSSQGNKRFCMDDIVISESK